MKSVRKAMLLMVVTLAMFGCGGRHDGRAEAPMQPNAKLAADDPPGHKPLTLGQLNVAMDGAPWRDAASNSIRVEWTISGTLINETDRTLPNVKVEIEWYDPTGRLLDSGEALVESTFSGVEIEPGRLAKFRFDSTTTSPPDEFTQAAQELLSASKVEVRVTSAGRALAYLPGNGWERLKTPPASEDLVASQRQQDAARDDFVREWREDLEKLKAARTQQRSGQ